MQLIFVIAIAGKYGMPLLLLRISKLDWELIAFSLASRLLKNKLCYQLKG